jgi:hypothetical protein
MGAGSGERRARSEERGAWGGEWSAWSMEHGEWSVEPGAWGGERGAWSGEHGAGGRGVETAEGKAEPEHSEDELLRRPNTKETRNRPTAPTDRRTDERRWYNIWKMPYQ